MIMNIEQLDLKEAYANRNSGKQIKWIERELHAQQKNTTTWNRDWYMHALTELEFTNDTSVMSSKHWQEEKEWQCIRLTNVHALHCQLQCMTWSMCQYVMHTWARMIECMKCQRQQDNNWHTTQLEYQHIVIIMKILIMESIIHSCKSVILCLQNDEKSLLYQ